MNSTSTSTTANTTTGQGAASGAHGTGLASKIKGAAQVVHGAGENIRGTLLGGVDTVVHDSNATSTNDVIAAKGREQTARGIANLKGVPPSTSTTATGAGAGVGHPGAGYDSTSRYPPYSADAGTQNAIPNYDGPGNAQYPTRHDRPVEEPHHHREDAIDLDATHGAAAGPGSTSVPGSRVN